MRIHEISPTSIVNAATKLAPDLVAKLEQLVQRNTQFLSSVEHMAQDPRMNVSELEQYLIGIVRSMDDIQYIKGADHVAAQVKQDLSQFLAMIEQAHRYPYLVPTIRQNLPQLVQALRNKLQRVHGQ